ncbi:Serine/threonine-protein kinase [Actinidia chinensis var. chinensis]|uniref:Serine/threonine-protein kinase n=1 Tax=Actinidia chinensis var. chinensis TaxID=1590841 RepID=A0A2R6RRV7_ACTCC|nr:Serine/threonine-protein kinase [Actinidia chinensis var. chinensis]
MNSRISVASAVSCKLGNTNNFFFWILVCLLSKFFKNPTANVNFCLFNDIDRILAVSESFEELHPWPQLIFLVICILCQCFTICIRQSTLGSMVSSQLPALTETHICKSFQSRLFFPGIIPDVVPSDNVELDFSDVFGPLLAQALAEVGNVEPENSVPATNVTELIYDDLVVIYKRSHSLVGPPTCVSQSSRLNKLIIHETGFYS